MPSPGNVEIMTPAGMITLDEGELLEVLESLCQRIDRKLDSGRDRDTAYGLELIQIYDKLNVGQERVIPKFKESRDMEVEEVIQELSKPRKKRRK